MSDFAVSLRNRYVVLYSFLSESQRRLFLGAEADELGPGGVRLVADAVGVSPDTVRRGRAEARSGTGMGVGRSRKPGGGRKRAEAHDDGLGAALDVLISPTTRGDPQSPLRWTTKSVRGLADELTAQGHPVSDFVVRRVLHEWGYSLQGNAKTVEGAQHPDRDAQFGYINTQAEQHMAAGEPVISVDAKKKELVGDFKNTGREWQPKGSPERVRAHDFEDPVLGKANPYGVYDIAADTGWVSVGTDHDTAQFAVATIRSWWDHVGRTAYPHATRLLITADGGGSNGSRNRLWKTGLAQFAADTGLAITCCHLPPGTSKWNTIEHRLFSHISLNWRGRPLTSHDVIINTIAHTHTRTGLTVHAELDTHDYPVGIKIPDTT